MKALFTIPACNLSSELCHDVDSCLGGGAEALETKGKEFPVQPFHGATDLLDMLLAFSTCFLYLHENVLPCGLTNQRRYRFDIYMYRSRQSSCQSTKAVKPVKAVKLSRQLSCQSIQAVKAVKLSKHSNCQGS